MVIPVGSWVRGSGFDSCNSKICSLDSEQNGEKNILNNVVFLKSAIKGQKGRSECFFNLTAVKVHRTQRFSSKEHQLFSAMVSGSTVISQFGCDSCWEDKSLDLISGASEPDSSTCLTNFIRLRLWMLLGRAKVLFPNVFLPPCLAPILQTFSHKYFSSISIFVTLQSYTLLTLKFHLMLW